MEGKRKSKAIVEFNESDDIFELVQMRGNFWRVMGCSINSKNYLFVEEVLYLLEKSQLLVQRSMELLGLEFVYSQIVDKLLPISCYVTYLKLKKLDYIVLRHSSKRHIRAFDNDDAVLKHLVEHPESSLLDTVVSFDLYPQCGKFSKKNKHESKCAGYVIISEGECVLSSAVLFAAMREADGVPIMIAAVMATGHVILEEFTNAQSSLSWVW